MARRRGNAPRQVLGRDFTQQSEARSNFALSATRSKAGGAGNTGEGQFAPVYRRRRPTKAAMGAGLNFARRRRGIARGLGAQRPPRDAAQRPAVSDRQYRARGVLMTLYTFLSPRRRAQAREKMSYGRSHRMPSPAFMALAQYR